MDVPFYRIDSHKSQVVFLIGLSLLQCVESKQVLNHLHFSAKVIYKQQK